MNIQPINQQTNNNIGFQKLIVKKGSFNVLRNSEYFPESSYPNYYKNLKSFYKKMMEIAGNTPGVKVECEKNDIYNVVIRPSSKDFEGGVYIENAEGKAQFGFFRSFRKIFEVEAMKPKKLLTERQDPRLLDRLFRNWKIKRYNNRVKHQQVSMQDFLTSVYKHIEESVNNADYLAELHTIKKQ